MSENQQSSSSSLDAIKAQRAALKDFYKLKNKTVEPVNDKKESDNVNYNDQETSSLHKQTSITTIEDLDPKNIDDIDAFIANETYLNLLKTENIVLDRLNSSKSEIKSIIYNNYYELIKINNILEDLLEPKDSQVYSNTITNNLDLIKSNIQTVKNLDLDIFGDLSANNKNSKAIPNSDIEDKTG